MAEDNPERDWIEGEAGMLADAEAAERPRCSACGDRIEDGFDVRDDDGNVYCEGCWSP